MIKKKFGFRADVAAAGIQGACDAPDPIGYAMGETR
jgi:hypothetical protein